MDEVPVTAVTDAKDAYDCVSADASSFGQQTSLAFTATWLRQVSRGANVALRWAATENMIAEALTKAMGSTYLRDTLQRGQWSV
eukprot:14763967-Alexandrium_andersonii.AAC.1